MTQTVGRLLSFLLLLLAAVFAFQRAQEPEYFGLDFVQFHLTGLHVVHGGDPHVYSDKVRIEILEHAWQEAQTEGIETKFYQAVNFRHERSWESYSSPFLYALFGVTGGRSRIEVVRSRMSMNAPSSGLSAAFSPDAGEKGRSEVYERAIKCYWIVCLGSTIIGFTTLGWVLRIPGWSMLSGAVILVWFCPLRIDMNVANVDQIQFGMVGVLAAILSAPVYRSLRRPESRSSDRIHKTESRRRSDGSTVRQFVAGVWMGLCLAFKPSLLWCGVMWLAIGCQIHLLTSNLVWYQYCVLSLPAVLVVLREVVCTSSRRDAIFLSGMLLWCLLLLGFQPVDNIVASPSVEHMLRCTIANTILIILIVAIPKTDAEVTGAEQQSIGESYLPRATLT